MDNAKVLAWKREAGTTDGEVIVLVHCGGALPWATWRACIAPDGTWYWYAGCHFGAEDEARASFAERS